MIKKMGVIRIKRIWFFGTLLTLTLFFSPFDKVLAEKIGLNSEASDTSIFLDWEGTSNQTFEVYRDDKLIFNGSKSTYTDAGLEPNNLYSYDIVLYNDQKEIDDIIKHKVKTKNKSNSEMQTLAVDVNTYDFDTEIKTTINKNNVVIEWGNLEDDDGIYELYRDDVKIADVRGNIFTDNKIKKGSSYRYKIIAEKAISESKKKSIQEELIKEGFKLKDIPSSAYIDRKTITKDVSTLTKLDKKEILKRDLTSDLTKLTSPKAGTLDSYIFRYTTFIPMKYVNNKNWLAGDAGTYLKGDGSSNVKANWRKFDFFNNSFRTRVDVNPEWINSTGGFYFDKPIVSQSVLYETSSAIGKSCGSKGVRCATASNSGIKVIKEYVNSSYIEWRVEHSASVPFGVSYPGIDYRYDARIYKNGNVIATGNHDRAPNHEVYLAKAYTDLPYLKLHTFSISGEGDFYNLFPPVPNEYWQYNS